MTTILRPAAQQDLDDHAAYLTQHAGINVASRFLDAARQTLDDLARMPGLGSPYPLRNSSLQGLRHFSIRKFPKHIIFYRELASGGIEVFRILHSARNLTAILEQESG